mgnify:CR=1 FL=1
MHTQLYCRPNPAVAEAFVEELGIIKVAFFGRAAKEVAEAGFAPAKAIFDSAKGAGREAADLRKIYGSTLMSRVPGTGIFSRRARALKATRREAKLAKRDAAGVAKGERNVALDTLSGKDTGRSRDAALKYLRDYERSRPGIGGALNRMNQRNLGINRRGSGGGGGGGGAPTMKMLAGAGAVGIGGTLGVQQHLKNKKKQQYSGY